MSAALAAILKRVGWSGYATVQKVRRPVKTKLRPSGGGAAVRGLCDPASANSEFKKTPGNRPAGFPLSSQRLSTFIDFAAEGMRLVFRDNEERSQDCACERLAPAFERLGFDAQSRPRLKQLASFLEKLDRKACGRLVRTLDGFARRNQKGESRLNLEHLSFRLAAKEADIGVTEDGVPLRRRQLGLEQLQMRFQQAGEADLPRPSANGAGARVQRFPRGILFDLQGTGDAVQSTFDCGAAWVEGDSREQSGPDEGKPITPELSRESSPASPRLVGEWDHHSSVQASEVSTTDVLNIMEILSRFQPQESEERGGLYRVSNSAFRRDDGCEGIVFDYFFGFQQIK